MLLKRRWLALTGVVVLLVVLCGRLGLWQLNRHQERSAGNALVESNYQRPPAPVADLLAVGRVADRASTWRAVRATGTYDPAGTVLVRNRTRTGSAGVDVVVPLVTGTGTALLVNRGYVPRTRAAAELVDLPAPPSGEVTVTGHVAPAQGDGSTEVTRGTQVSVPRLDVPAVAAALGRETYGAAVNLTEEVPPPERAPEPPEPPGTSIGPHLSYMVQWWMFGCFAIAGWVVLLRRDLQEERDGPPPVPQPTPAGRT
jgi:cytochrome oxidase assembly protein ShyY1